MCIICTGTNLIGVFYLLNLQELEIVLLVTFHKYQNQHLIEIFLKDPLGFSYLLI